MCGIFGLANGPAGRTVSHAVCSLVKQAFIVGSLRGFDSSGVFQQDAKGMWLHKAAMPGYFFVDDKKASRFLRDADVSMLTVGHNRAATEGKVTDDNAHPFTVYSEDPVTATSGMVIGVHNGTLNGWKSREDAKGFSVDSEWAFTRIARDGVDAFKKFYGAYCFVWTDDRVDDRFFIARNDQRPMHFAYMKDGDRMLFASEAGMLSWLAERNNIVLEDKIYVVEPDQLYTFQYNALRAFTKVSIPKAEYASSYSGTYRSGSYTEAAGETFLKKLREAVTSGSGKRRPKESVVPVLPPKDLEVLPQQSINPFLDNFADPATDDEALQAYMLGVHDLKVSFEPVLYDDDKHELYGHVTTDEDTLVNETEGLMRNIPPAIYAKWKDRDDLRVHIVGVSTGHNNDVMPILCRSSAKTMEEAEHKKRSDLDSAVKAIAHERKGD